jgi:phospholipid transport system substrate-binding protein
MTLGRNWLKLDDSQRSQFIELYRLLLEKNYMGQLLKYTDEKVVFDRQTMLSEKKAAVDSNIVSSDKKIPITYRLIRRDGDWKVYDLVIEGISLVSNYRTQFNDILSRQTPTEMLVILRKKVTDKSG